MDDFNILEEEDLPPEDKTALHAITFDDAGDLTLTKQQKDKITEIWNNSSKINPPSINGLAKAVFGNDVNKRDPRIKLLKKFLSEVNFNAPNHDDIVIKEVALSDEQKEFIRNNYGENTTTLEIARILFNNSTLSGNSKEFNAVSSYIVSLQLTGEISAKHTMTEYNPPKNIAQAVVRIKKYVPKIDWVTASLKEVQRKCAESLINYLNTMRFINQIMSHKSQADKDLFESEFVRCTYDKPDLTEEDIDQYIIYSNEVIISKNILININNIQEKLNDDLNSKDENDQKMAVNQGLAEMISTMRGEYNSSIKRQQDLLKNLTVTRGTRIADQKAETASIVNLVNAFKQEEFRKKTILLAKRKQEALKESIRDYASMEEIKAKIWGVTEEDIING